MREDAAEFVPGSLIGNSSAASDEDTKKRTLSADTPEFIPGAALAEDQTQAWQPETRNGYWSAAYGSSQDNGMSAYEENFGYVDEEHFLTPRLLSEEELQQLLVWEREAKATERGESADASSEAVKKDTEEGGDAQAMATESTDMWPALGEVGTKGKKGKRGGKGGKGAPASATVAQSYAASSQESKQQGGSAVIPEVTVDEIPEGMGSLRVDGRKLVWTISSVDCSKREPRPLDSIPQGESIRSCKFCVAGVVLQLAFFPSGTNLTGEGDCAVGVHGGEKAKLKFQLFLNGRGSGTKVMLGQKFSCDFKKPNMSGTVEGQVIEIGIEIFSNLLYTGFY